MTALAEAAAGERRGPLQILLVEDDDGDALLATERLQGIGSVEVTLAVVTTLAAALARLDGEHFDAVVLDPNLPDSTGLDTLHEIRRRDARVPIVVLTGMESREFHAAAIGAGAEDSIAKDEPQASLLARSVLYAIERRRAISRSREAESLIAASPDAIMVVDTDGVVQFVNDAAVELFGRARDELLGDDVMFSVEPGAVTSLEIVHQHRERRAEMRVVDIDWLGRPACLAVIRDTTEQERITAQLRHAQKMDAIGRLAGGVAHDFNNQLTVILACAEMALEDDAHDIRDLLTDITTAAGQAARTTSQLLAFSRNAPQHVTAVDLNEVLEQAGRLVTRVLGEDIELELDLDEQLDPVLADRGNVEQVVMNLAINARDAMPSGGNLLFASRRVDVVEGDQHASEGMLPGTYMCLIVSDTGDGMSLEVQQQIFEPFFTTKEVGRGTGLGLATVYGIVSQSGGWITVDSAPGQGATFRVFLPAAPVEELRRLEAARRPPRGARGGGTVLIVEDEEPVRRIATSILERSGYTVIGAGSGDRALELLDLHRIDVVLTDLVMPDMYGDDLVHIMRARGLRLPVVYMSGYPMGSRDLTPVPSEMPFLDKPFTAAELIGVVEAAMSAAGLRPPDGMSGS
ncbi:MAG: response regulator [Ilumatobacteraceae bacterium]